MITIECKGGPHDGRVVVCVGWPDAELAFSSMADAPMAVTAIEIESIKEPKRYRYKLEARLGTVAGEYVYQGSEPGERLMAGEG